MIFSCDLISNYPGKISKLIQNHQGTDKGFLSRFENVEVLKGTDVVEVSTWAVRKFPYFNISQDSPNGVERRELAQKKE